MSSAPYDPNLDMEGSLNVAYQAIRERIANGGPPWTPKLKFHDKIAEAAAVNPASTRRNRKDRSVSDVLRIGAIHYEHQKPRFNEMAHWQSEWHAFEKMPIVALEWMNWDDDDDGKTHRVWWSYVVYPWDDTAHLMHSPVNAAELDAAIAELDAGLGIRCDFTAASEPAFSKIWDNPQDAIYDQL